MRTVKTTWVVLGMAVVALVLAGVVSFYASSSPDGLNRVAEDKGFSSTEKDHAAGDGPLAGYETKDVGNARASKAIAGITGTLVVLVLAGGLTFVVRRRQNAPA
ncbi:PDGLE domain-containing protein [Nocardioides sp.]|uniref:PDGLE domain-containing protein n=1 Tax=Nocardioides sp. TaxID=35761 RepID=UPI0039E2A311